MLILSIRTDKPQAEIGLFDGKTQLAYKTWQAHHELSNTIHIKVEQLLDQQHKKFQDVQGIVCFQGPGSFTGLRIGLTVGNTLAYSYSIPIVGTSGDDWVKDGLQKLCSGQNDTLVMPEYGADANITTPRK